MRALAKQLAPLQYVHQSYERTLHRLARLALSLAVTVDTVKFFLPRPSVRIDLLAQVTSVRTDLLAQVYNSMGTC